MKKGLILILLASMLFISACTIPYIKVELEPRCCIASDVNTNVVTDCTYAETDVICTSYFSDRNTQFVNQKCTDLSQCVNKLSCIVRNNPNKILLGDGDGDGIISPTDYTRLQIYINGQFVPPCYDLNKNPVDCKIVFDIDKNDIVDPQDLALLKKVILGINQKEEIVNEEIVEITRYYKDYIFCSENTLYKCENGNIVNIFYSDLNDPLNIFDDYAINIENVLRNCCIEFDGGKDYYFNGGILCFE